MPDAWLTLTILVMDVPKRWLSPKLIPVPAPAASTQLLGDGSTGEVGRGRGKWFRRVPISAWRLFLDRYELIDDRIIGEFQ